MLHPNQVEELLLLVGGLDRPTLVRLFHAYPANFPVDFTNEFLQNLPIDRLRHLFVALCLQTQRMPEVVAGADPVAA